ncbi:MAG: CDP-alcohol phosphatidyltransferase family protein, partial [Gemmatimonadaceae bacterium]
MLAPDRSRRHLRGDPDRPRNRAVVILPNGFTLASLFFGVFAIVSASRGEFDTAGLYIVFGGVCDALDGRVARATGTGSRFGSELDSL